MEDISALSLVKRHDGSYFYIMELGFSGGLYKYLLANWNKNKLDEPKLIYSHTKRSSLNKVQKEFFDINLLRVTRIEWYKKQNNVYIGGIQSNGNYLARTYHERIDFVPIKYAVYKRKNNYILVEKIGTFGKCFKFNIYEFINTGDVMDFQLSPVFTEKDLLHLQDEEKEYVINQLLDPKRIEDKIKNKSGYIGTVEKINGVFRKQVSASALEQVKKLNK